MAAGAETMAWDVGAELWALTANINRAPDSPQYGPWQVHPHRTREEYHGEQPDGADVTMLRGLVN